MASCGRNWPAVAARVPGRNTQQVRDRFSQVLDPNVTKGPFSVKELTALEEVGGGWMGVGMKLIKMID